jgi:hypothetical protein
MFKTPLFSAKVFEAKYVTRPGGDLALQQGEFNHSYQQARQEQRQRRRCQRSFDSDSTSSSRGT